MSSLKQIARPLVAGDNHAPCWGCGGSVPRRDGETPAEHARRKTCCMDCAAGAGVSTNELWAAIWADLEAMHEPCTSCGEKFPHAGRHESRRRYVARRSCGDAGCLRRARSTAARNRCPRPGGGDLLPGFEDEAGCGELTPPTFGPADFGRHNVTDRDAGVFPRLSRPDVVTTGGVSAAWAVAQ